MVNWTGAQIAVDAENGVIVVTIPVDKIKQLRDDCHRWVHGRGMISEKKLQIFAGSGLWLGGLLPQVRPFVRQMWGELAAPRAPEERHLV